MKIKISLGKISQAIKQVEDYKKALADKEREFLKRLAEIGVEEATARFTTAQYDGTNDVQVDAPIWLDDNKIAVRASGNAVTFIEFGTGYFYNSEGDEHPAASKYGFTVGGYGQGRGKGDFWYYKGEPGTNGETPKSPSMAAKGLVFTHGNPQNRCMWEASKKIREEILNIAREVFGK